MRKECVKSIGESLIPTPNTLATSQSPLQHLTLFEKKPLMEFNIVDLFPEHLKIVIHE